MQGNFQKGKLGRGSEIEEVVCVLGEEKDLHARVCNSKVD